jgi:hypothetical protein
MFLNEPVEIQIDGDPARLVDLSTSGAQVLSPNVLKPNRVVKILLPSADRAVLCRAKVVWARLEPPKPGTQPCYRAGVCFTNVDEQAVEAFVASHTPVS